MVSPADVSAPLWSGGVLWAPLRAGAALCGWGFHSLLVAVRYYLHSLLPCGMEGLDGRFLQLYHSLFLVLSPHPHPVKLPEGMLGVYCARHSEEEDAFAQLCCWVLLSEGVIECSVLGMGVLGIRSRVSVPYILNLYYRDLCRSCSAVPAAPPFGLLLPV